METTDMAIMQHFFKKPVNKATANKGLSLVELIIVIAIMAVLIVVITPAYTKYIHKSKVATDWANLRTYYDEIQLDFLSTGQYNPAVPTNVNDLNYFKRTEINFLDGRTVQMQDGYFAVTRDAGRGYQIAYYCNKCLSDWDKHSKSCELILFP